jgi:hypothetical protein
LPRTFRTVPAAQDEAPQQHMVLRPAGGGTRAGLGGRAESAIDRDARDPAVVHVAADHGVRIAHGIGQDVPSGSRRARGVISARVPRCAE